MIGTQCLRNRFADSNPPGSPFTHGRSWPSWQRLGVMNEKLGVVDADSRSFESAGRGTTRRLHDGESITEWKYMNGLCFVAYWSAGVAHSVESGRPIVGCPHVDDSRVSSAPMSSM